MRVCPGLGAPIAAFFGLLAWSACSESPRKESANIESPNKESPNIESPKVESPKVETARETTQAAQPETPAVREGAMSDKGYVLDYVMNRIDGSPQELSEYRGKVVLVVNVASECGLTPQYEGLEKLYRERKDDGLVILGVPANNFGGQEPGTNEDIASFCTGRYSVTFPMFEKVSVLGDDAAPLYKQLTGLSGAPDWNFTKYLVGRDGRLIERFSPRVKPDDAGLTAAIDRALGGA